MKKTIALIMCIIVTLAISIPAKADEDTGGYHYYDIEERTQYFYENFSSFEKIKSETIALGSGNSNVYYADTFRKTELKSVRTKANGTTEKDYESHLFTIISDDAARSWTETGNTSRTKTDSHSCVLYLNINYTDTMITDYTYYRRMTSVNGNWSAPNNQISVVTHKVTIAQQGRDQNQDWSDVQRNYTFASSVTTWSKPLSSYVFPAIYFALSIQGATYNVTFQNTSGSTWSTSLQILTLNS